MKSSNSLFLDEEYKLDCEKKIDYFRSFTTSSGITYNEDNITTNRPSVTAFKKISDNFYKVLNSSNENSNQT